MLTMQRHLLALPIIAVLSAQPALAQDDAIVVQAREAARTDRNREAADLFAIAIRNEPLRRAELLKEYADQLTYSDRAREAVPHYQELLASEPTAEEALPVLRGLALALAWSGQHREAVRVYDQLLARDPDDAVILAMRGKVKGWSRDYLGAVEDLKQASARDPDNLDTIKALAENQSLAGFQRDALETLKLLPEDADAQRLRFLARTQLWAGRPSAARDTAAKVLAINPQDRAALDLARQGKLATSPLVEVSVRYSEQSDESNFWQVASWQTLYPSEDTAFGIGYDGFYFRPPDRSMRLDVHRPAISGRSRLSESLELNGQLGLTLIESEPRDSTRVTWNGWGTFAPSDILRFDAGLNRSTLDNIRSNELGIFADTYSVSADVGSDASWKLSARAALTDFSDGNTREWGQAEVRRRLLWNPNLFVGARYTRFTFDQQLGNGYFDPAKLSSFEATAQAWGRLGAFWYDMRGSLGREDASASEVRTTYSGEAKLTYQVSAAAQFELYLNSFSSRTDAPGGFSRTTAGISLRSRW
ncbi:MAG: hypothetical protein U0975_08220 [Erythrobacter sp.]|nr:hypothetical protein [Erythrobacter sp.]MDZ4272643.1 hypothetical protein [Erythrobacter sp.]